MATKTTPANGAVSKNGDGPEVETELPVDTFKDAARHLRRPFTEQAVKFKVQATWDGGGLIVGYIDARLAVERLNLVCPHLWKDAYEPTNSGLMWCHLTVDDITRSDVGEGQGKGLVSDALKRAAVRFGVGVSLYAIPQMRLNVNDGHLRVTNKDKTVLTPNGEAECRTRYKAWLELNGKKAFGEPLDHGDVDDAVGDAVETAEPAAAAAAGDAVLSDEQVERMKAAVEADERDTNMLLAAAGIDINARVTVAQAEKLKALLEEVSA